MVKKKRLWTQISQGFNRHENVRGKKIPINENTIKLLLYLGVYSIMIFDMLVFLITIQFYFPK